MKFHGKAGQEVRTWVLFGTGIALVLFFAYTKNPLNPWWTLVIGAFTCTAILVSAVTSLTGGINDAARKAVEEEQKRRNDSSVDSKEKVEKTLSVALGSRFAWALVRIRSRNAVPILAKG